MLEETFLALGASIGYWRGDIKGLVDDISALRPTLFIGVPRVFDRIYTGILNKVKAGGGIKGFLFNWGFNRKLHYLKEGVSNDRVRYILPCFHPQIRHLIASYYPA